MSLFRRGVKNLFYTQKRGVEEFIDQTLFNGKVMERTGRRWRINEVRQKSYEDLQNLWFVLFKERNMLLTMKNLSRTMERRLNSPSRLVKVKKSMQCIKQVLKERNMKALEMAKKEFEQNKRDNKYYYPINQSKPTQIEK